MALQKQEVIQMITADYIKNRASELGIELDDVKAAKLYAYYQAVEETNKRIEFPLLHENKHAHTLGSVQEILLKLKSE